MPPGRRGWPSTCPNGSCARASTPSRRTTCATPSSGSRRRAGWRRCRTSKPSPPSAPASTTFSPTRPIRCMSRSSRRWGSAMTQRMREYVALHVLRMHRDQPALERAAAERRWAQAVVPPATARRVGVMGLGTLGRAAAATLMNLGFPRLGLVALGRPDRGHGELRGRRAARLRGQLRHPRQPAAADAADARHPRRAPVRHPAARRLPAQRRTGAAPGGGRPAGGARRRPHRARDAGRVPAPSRCPPTTRSGRIRTSP